MKLARVEIENYRAIEKLDLPLNPRLTVLHGDNGHGKTSVLSAIATGLGSIPGQLPDVSGVGFLQSDRRGSRQLRVGLTTVDGIAWERRVGGPQKRNVLRELKEVVEAIVKADREGTGPLHLPIVAFYDTDRAVFDPPQRRRGFGSEFPQSDPERGQGRVLDPENMIVCCKGGTLKTPDVARWQKPSKTTAVAVRLRETV